MSFKINGETLNKALEISWKGLLAIFIVIAVIILLTVTLNLAVNKLSPKLSSHFNRRKETRRQKKLMKTASLQQNHSPHDKEE